MNEKTTPAVFHPPFPHMNGTGSATLSVEYAALTNALEEVEMALEGLTVHMRDYYVQPDGQEKFREMREYIARLTRTVMDARRKSRITLYMLAGRVDFDEVDLGTDTLR